MILITGGMGFIGLHTARRLLDAGEEVLLGRHRSQREPEFLRQDLGKRASIVPLDITDREATFDLLKRYPISAIAHLAGPRRGRLALEDEFQIAILGFLNVLDGAIRAGVHRVILGGVIGVYSNLASGPFHEDAPLSAASGSSNEAAKKAWEVLGLRYTAQTELEVISLRISIVYGPLYDSMANLPSRLCHAAARGTPPDLDGLRVGSALADDAHDLCYVKDCAAGIQSVVMAKRLSHQIYNLGGGRAVRNAELSTVVAEAANREPARLPPGTSTGMRPDPYMDLTRITTDTGFAPQWDLRAGVSDYLQWLRVNSE